MMHNMKPLLFCLELSKSALTLSLGRYFHIIQDNEQGGTYGTRLCILVRQPTF